MAVFCLCANEMERSQGLLLFLLEQLLTGAIAEKVLLSLRSRAGLLQLELNNQILARSAECA